MFKILALSSIERSQQITNRYAKSPESINDGMQSVSAESEETSTEIVHVSECGIIAFHDFQCYYYYYDS